MIWWALLLIAGMMVAMYFWATELDARKYMDPKQRGQVVEVFKKGMKKEEVKRVYYKVNLRELMLMLGGMVVGAVLGAF